MRPRPRGAACDNSKISLLELAIKKGAWANKLAANYLINVIPIMASSP